MTKWWNVCKTPSTAKTVQRKELVMHFDGGINSASLYYDSVQKHYEVRFIHDWNRIWAFDSLKKATDYARKQCGL